MKSVGRYAVLMNNSFQKTTWKQYGIETVDEQINLLFTVLLFIMEYSLKEEDCTLDEIAGFIGSINDLYFKREYSYEDLKNLADFIINVVLGNSGSAMYFKGYDYEKREYTDININYLANKIVYLENGLRRTAYYLTEDGYNMILSTMELENNLKLTVHEMLFKLHLEKADYDRAVNDIKNVFDQLRIQNQKIQEAMRKIRQNALAYSVEEYRQIVEENIGTVEKTREEFRLHREMIEKRVKEFEDQEINVKTLTELDKKNLGHLKIIDGYLGRSLDEHQKILKEHFDLKSLYDMELENYSNMTMVQRFHFRSELYDKIIREASMLENLQEVFRPLFWHPVQKIYNPDKAFEYQKRLRKAETEEETVELLLEEEAYRKEMEQRQKERLKKYEGSLFVIIEKIVEKTKISLLDFKAVLEEEENETAEERGLSNAGKISGKLFPTLEIFREIIIELLTAGTIDVEALRRERSEYTSEINGDFQLNEMLLDIIEKNNLSQIKKLHICRTDEEAAVRFQHIKNENGEYKNLRCSNIELWYE